MRWHSYSSVGDDDNDNDKEGDDNDNDKEEDDDDDGDDNKEDEEDDGDNDKEDDDNHGSDDNNKDEDEDDACPPLPRFCEITITAFPRFTCIQVQIYKHTGIKLSYMHTNTLKTTRRLHLISPEYLTMIEFEEIMEEVFH